jgi:sporulation protein YlmC with PRC-barrel domain
VSSVRALRGDKVAARDGIVGRVEDVFFDQRWAVRYFLVDTGERRPGERVLIAPASVEPGLSGPRKIRLALTREQIEGGEEAGAAHLRSGADVIGYAVQARDGPIGRLRDIVVDDDTWAIRGVVVDTRPWWPGGEVRVDPQHVERIDWRGRKVHLRLTRKQLKLQQKR